MILDSFPCKLNLAMESSFIAFPTVCVAARRRLLGSSSSAPLNAFEDDSSSKLSLSIRGSQVIVRCPGVMRRANFSCVHCVMIMIRNAAVRRDDHGAHYNFDISRRSGVRYSSDDAHILEKFLANNVACQNQVVDNSHDWGSVLSFGSVPNCFLFSF
jgi:hypothetical protein